MVFNILHIDSMKGMTFLDQRYSHLSSPAPSLVSGQVFIHQSDVYLQETRGARTETCVNVKYRCQNGTLTTTGDHWLISFHGNTSNVTNPIAGLRLNSDGSLEVRQRESGHAAQLGITSPGVIALDTDYTIEFLFKSSTSAVGRFIVAVNGVTLLSVSGIVTAYGAGNSSWVLGCADTGTPFDINDYYWDTTVTGSSSGTADMVGPTTYYQLVPTGVGAITQLPVLSGANWDAVNDMPIDLGLTYVRLPTSGTARDSYQMSDMPGGAPPIVAVAARCAIGSQGSGTWTAEVDLLTDGTYRRVGGVISVPATTTTPTYIYYAVNPPDVLRGDGGAWDAAWLNRSEIGITATLTSGSPVSGARVTQIHLDVCCAGVPTVSRPGYALIVG